MNIVKRYLVPLLYSTGFAALTLLAGCGGDNGRDPILGMPGATFTSLTVTPATASVAAGNTQQFTVNANYSDGSARDVTAASVWLSATPAAATVNPSTGLATGVAVGTSVISANYGGKSGSATLTVTPALLVSVAITPLTPSAAVGLSRQFTLLGTYTDRSVRDLTSTSTFVSSVPATATITTTGLASAKAAGTTTITGTSGTLSANTVLTVTPATLASIALAPQAPTVQTLAARQLAVTATYSDATTADVTALSTFVSATPAAATVNATGNVQGVAAGSSVVTASFGGRTATTTVTVPAVTLSSIAVTPAKPSIAVGAQQQFIVNATYSDASTAIVGNAAWTSSSAATATVTANGVATGVAAGTSTITATLGGKTATAALTVTAAATAPTVLGLNLGSAATYGVLAGTSITNSGTTLVNGDVGSPLQTVAPTLAAGFTNLTTTTAALTTALADVQLAVTDGNARTCDITVAGAVDLGGKTLAPGVYCYTGAVTITGALTLNGPGVYIFRTATTLNTSANSSIVLSGGATADSVSWLPVGAVTLGANSVFKGNILGRTGAITLGDGALLINGRVLTATTVILRNNQIAK